MTANSKKAAKSDPTATTLRAIKDLAEMIKRKVDWMEVHQRSVAKDVDFLRDQTSIVNEKLDDHTKKLDDHTKKLDAHTETLQTHTEKLDTLLVDVNELKDDTKANWDKITIVDEKHTRAIKEIREHIGLSA